MPTAKRAKVVPLPPVGAAYAVPLANGIWGGCRVIRVGDPTGIGGKRAVLVGALAYVGRTPPTGTEPGVAKLLSLNHPAHHGPAVIWIPGYRGPVPASFVPITPILPKDEDLARPPCGYGGWQWISIRIEAQRRWDHEPEDVLREEAEAKVRAAEIERVAAADRRRTLDALTLADLRAKRPFASWRGTPAGRRVAAARAAFVNMIDGLAALGPRPTFATAEPLLRACVERFNELDERYDHFIETIEREDICEHFARVVHVAGIADDGASGDLTERWRDW